MAMSDARYEDHPYEFTASSRTRSGDLRELDPTVERKNETVNGGRRSTIMMETELDTVVIVTTIRQALVSGR